MPTITLAPFQIENAGLVLSWVQSAEELYHWASRTGFPLTDVSIFKRWHADPDVTPYELLVDRDVVGYGEIWCEPTDPWAELARLIVAPQHRHCGLGKRLVDELATQIHKREFDLASMRICPTNLAALACYTSAGFTRLSEPKERELNAGQPQAYVWLQRRIKAA